jgi:SAM-dependent methyltransferase
LASAVRGIHHERSLEKGPEMCSINCIRFGKENLSEKEIAGKKIIEVGSYDVNGSLREFIETLSPLQYVGADIVKGYGVDVICAADRLLEKFGEGSFDVIVSTELLEHVKDWRTAISNIKRICRPGGIVLITTRSYGFAYHGWPYDFWRYEMSDMKQIFSDCVIESLEADAEPGVLLKARKPADFAERDLSDVTLYSIIADRRIKDMDDGETWEMQQKHLEEFRLQTRQSFKGKIRVFVRDIFWELLRRRRIYG